MTPEYIKVHIGNALDLIQLITEDVEDNFINPHLNSLVTARARLVCSSLSVLSNYLRGICAEAAEAPPEI